MLRECFFVSYFNDYRKKSAINLDKLFLCKIFNEIIINFLFHRMKFGHTIDDSRKKHPEITDELIKSLQKWADDRDLPKIPEEQLALFAHSCYYDLAATERCMDAYYRMRSTIPEIFHNRDPEYLQHSLKALYVHIGIFLN